MSMSPKWHLAYFVPIDGHFEQIGRYGLVLPGSYINIDIQTNFEVNQTQIGHSISTNTPKITICNGHISKPQRARNPKKTGFVRFWAQIFWRPKSNLKSISTNLPKMAINWHKIGQMPLWRHGNYLAITWSFFIQF